MVGVAMRLHFRGSNMRPTVRGKNWGALLGVVVSNEFQNDETEGMDDTMSVGDFYFAFPLWKHTKFPIKKGFIRDGPSGRSPAPPIHTPVPRLLAAFWASWSSISTYAASSDTRPGPGGGDDDGAMIGLGSVDVMQHFSLSLTFQ